MSALGLCVCCMLRVSGDNNLDHYLPEENPDNKTCVMCFGLFQRFNSVYKPQILQEINQKLTNGAEYSLSLAMPSFLLIRSSVIHTHYARDNSKTSMLGIKEIFKHILSKVLIVTYNAKLVAKSSLNISLIFSGDSDDCRLLSLINQTHFAKPVGNQLPCSERKEKQRKLISSDPIASGSTVAITRCLELLDKNDEYSSHPLLLYLLLLIIFVTIYLESSLDFIH